MNKDCPFYLTEEYNLFWSCNLIEKDGCHTDCEDNPECRFQNYTKEQFKQENIEDTD